eukprot:3036836-Heterocapsa_arctica.AAC.1
MGVALQARGGRSGPRLHRAAAALPTPAQKCAARAPDGCTAARLCLDARPVDLRPLPALVRARRP